MAGARAQGEGGHKPLYMAADDDNWVTVELKVRGAAVAARACLRCRAAVTAPRVCPCGAGRVSCVLCVLCVLAGRS